MQIPDVLQAYISTGTLKDYLLNAGHPTAGPRARVFLRYGYWRMRHDELAQDLVQLLRTSVAQHTRKTPHGVRYVVVGLLNTPRGQQLRALTVWQVDRRNNLLRLVTARPIEGDLSD